MEEDVLLRREVEVGVLTGDELVPVIVVEEVVVVRVVVVVVPGDVAGAWEAVGKGDAARLSDSASCFFHTAMLSSTCCSWILQSNPGSLLISQYRGCTMAFMKPIWNFGNGIGLCRSKMAVTSIPFSRCLSPRA